MLAVLLFFAVRGVQFVSSPLPSVCRPAPLCGPRGSVCLSSPSLLFAVWLVFAVRWVLFVSSRSQVFAVRLVFAVREVLFLSSCCQVFAVLLGFVVRGVLFVSPSPSLVLGVRLVFSVCRVLFVSPSCLPSIYCGPARLCGLRGSIPLYSPITDVCSHARLCGLHGPARLSPTCMCSWSSLSLLSMRSGSSLLPPPLFCGPVCFCGPWGPNRRYSLLLLSYFLSCPPCFWSDSSSFMFTMIKSGDEIATALGWANWCDSRYIMHAHSVKREFLACDHPHILVGAEAL